MSNVFWKGSAIFGPHSPALVTCHEDGKTNVLTIGWTGIMSTHPPMTYISVRPERHSYGMIERTGVFVINFPTAQMVKAADYCGVKSGKNTDKIEKMDLKLTEGSSVPVPSLEDSPLSLECRVTQKIDMGTHSAFIAEITAVRTDDGYLDGSGKLDLRKAGLISYLHGEYFEQGKCIGSIGFSVMKKNTAKKLGKKPGIKK
ncbi:MAG: flavin reductase family protein [Clostridia bacterium]|nr:flavin reductase family protein [Clostridia bacterium]